MLQLRNQPPCVCLHALCCAAHLHATQLLTCTRAITLRYCCRPCCRRAHATQSFHLWLNLAAIAISASGLRRYLDPASPAALPALGWLDGVLAWFSSACIPVLLFANGVWMCGKDIVGGMRGQAQVRAASGLGTHAVTQTFCTRPAMLPCLSLSHSHAAAPAACLRCMPLCTQVAVVLLLKLTLLPALMVALTAACNIRGVYGLSLVSRGAALACAGALHGSLLRCCAAAALLMARCGIS